MARSRAATRREVGEVSYGYADELRTVRTLIDPWDALAEVFIAEDAEGLQGTFRVVPLIRVAEQHGVATVSLAFGRLGVERAMSAFSLQAINVVGRLAVTPQRRGTPVVVSLMAAALEDGLTRGERLSLADCSPHLIPMYARLAGFVRSGADFHDPVYGNKAPLLGCLADHEAYRRSGAAIGPVSARVPDDAQARAFREEVERVLTVATGIHDAREGQYVFGGT